MGLDFRIESNNKLHAGWSYSGFMAFRKQLAHEICLVLSDMIGFGGDTEWPNAFDEPLVYLLDHSDCEGELTALQCWKLSPRLKDAIALWKTSYITGHLTEWYDIKQGENLCEMLDYCAFHNEPLLFR